MSQFFNKALSDFVHDYASGGAIRHLANLGYTVHEISEKLDFPTPEERIKETVWRHYIDTGVIRLTNPSLPSETEAYEFVKEYSENGKASFRKVKKEIETESREYIACDFGKQLYKDKSAFLAKLDTLNPKDKEYILGLPWPLTTVWHVADERMLRICSRDAAICHQESPLS